MTKMIIIKDTNSFIVILQKYRRDKDSCSDTKSEQNAP